MFKEKSNIIHHSNAVLKKENRLKFLDDNGERISDIHKICNLASHENLCMGNK